MRTVLTSAYTLAAPARGSYRDRTRTRLIGFIAASALVHLALLVLPGWPTSPLPLLTLPALHVSLPRPAASQPAGTERPGIASPRPVTAAPPLTHAATAGHTPTDPSERAASPSAQPGEGERLNHLQTLLHGALDRMFVYPPLARRHGWQGKVELSVELDANGRLHDARVLRSSGHSVLDQDALATLARIGALPEARGWLSGRGHRLALPIVYRLVEG